MPDLTPERAAEERLHERLLGGDVTAPAEIAERFAPALVTHLQRRFPNLYDPHLVETAADDALLDYLRRPQQFDPRRLSLSAYLGMAARGDLLNALRERRAEARRVALDDPAMDIELERLDEVSVEEQVARLASPLWRRLHALLPDPADHEIVLLMMEGERSTAAYAEVLGLSQHPAADQADHVKRHKDRLRKFLGRHLERAELSDHDE